MDAHKANSFAILAMARKELDAVSAVGQDWSKVFVNCSGQTFPACASTPATGEASLGGALSIGQFSIFFETDGLTVEMPLNDLQINLDPDDSHRILFHHSHKPGWEIASYSSELLNHPRLLQRTALREQILNLRDVNQSPAKHSALVWSVIAGIAALLVVLWLGNNLIIGFIVDRAPISWEEQMGQTIMKDVRREFDFVKDPAATNYVRAVGDRLVKAAPQSGHSYKFFVLDSPGINAFALPGGYVLVLSGLLDAVESPEELAGVMAHEIAHVTQRHALRKAAESAGPMFMARYFIGRKDRVFRSLAATSIFLGRQSFSREYEREADDVGMDYLLKSNIDPKGMLSFFEKLNRMDRGGPSDMAFLSSHPPTSERLEAMRKKVQKADRKIFTPFPRMEKSSEPAEQ